MAAGSNETERGFLLRSRLHEACEREQNLDKLRRSKGPFDRAVRALTTSIRESYESIVLENLPSSESIEQQLWRLHYSFITDFRGRLEKLKVAAVDAANIPNKKKVVEKQKFERVCGQYKCFLDEAAGFYHGLIAKLGAKYGLSGKLSPPSNRTEISSCNERFRRFHRVFHRCYVYLGDLARYKELCLRMEGRTPDWYVAANYYRQASALWPGGGHPHNQLGVLSMYAGDIVQGLYHYLSSLAVHAPFSTARANVKKIFDENQLHNSQLSNSPDEDVAIDIQMAQPFESHKSSTESHKECPLARLQRRFCVHFITLLGRVSHKPGLEEISEHSAPVLREANLLLSQDNMLITSSFTLEKSNPFKNRAFSVMQLVVLLILSIHNAGPKKERGSRISQGLEMSPFLMQATIFAFQFMTVVLQHCTRTEEPCCSHLFPAVVVFCSWLSSYPDFCQQIQVDEECDKWQCSFGREACTLLSKCMQQVGMAKNHENDSIAYSEKDGLHGTETVLWEDKELFGIVPLKYLEISETATRPSLLAKSTLNVAESACVMRVERLMKALMFLSSVLKLDSSELDAIASLQVCKSPFGWAFMRTSPSERTKCTQSSGGSDRTGDGSMQLKTQGPSIVQRSFEISLSSHFRKEDHVFLKAREQIPEAADPSKHTCRISDGPNQPGYEQKTITETEHKVEFFSEGTALQQPESELCDTNLETIPEDPRPINFEHKDDSTLGSAGRGALSLGDWVIAPAGGDNNLDASPALRTRSKSRPVAQVASQQAHTHSSAEESLNPSLSFKAVCRAPKPPLAPSRWSTGQPEFGDSPSKDQLIASPGACKETDTHASVSLNGQGSAQDPIDLGCEEAEKDATKPEAKRGLHSSQGRKRRHLSHEPSQMPSPEPSKGDEAVHQSEENGTKKKRDDVHVKADKHCPLATSVEETRPVVHATNPQELTSTSQAPLAQSVQIFPGPEAAPGHENCSGPTVGCSKQAPGEQNKKAGFPVDVPAKVLEDSSPVISGRGKKRKHDSLTPQAKTTLTTSRCQNCQGTSPGEGTSERLNWSAPQNRKYPNDLDAGFGRLQKHGYFSSPGSDMDRRTSWLPSAKRPRPKECDGEEDYSWLDTYTHVVPKALTKLASAIRKASFSFSDFGIFAELGARAVAAKRNRDLGQPSSQHPEQ